MQIKIPKIMATTTSAGLQLLRPPTNNSALVYPLLAFTGWLDYLAGDSVLDAKTTTYAAFTPPLFMYGNRTRIANTIEWQYSKLRYGVEKFVISASIFSANGIPALNIARNLLDKTKDNSSYGLHSAPGMINILNVGAIGLLAFAAVAKAVFPRLSTSQKIAASVAGAALVSGAVYVTHAHDSKILDAFNDARDKGQIADIMKNPASWQDLWYVENGVGYKTFFGKPDKNGCVQVEIRREEVSDPHSQKSIATRIKCPSRAP